MSASTTQAPEQASTVPVATPEGYTHKDACRDIARLWFYKALVNPVSVKKANGIKLPWTRSIHYDAETRAKALLLTNQVFESADIMGANVESAVELARKYPALSVPSFAKMVNAPVPAIKAKSPESEDDEDDSSEDEDEYEESKKYDAAGAQSEMWCALADVTHVYARDLTRHHTYEMHHVSHMIISPRTFLALRYINKTGVPALQERYVLRMFHSMATTGKSAKGSAWSVEGNDMFGEPELACFLMYAYFFYSSAVDCFGSDGVAEHIVNVEAITSIYTPNLKTQFKSLFDHYGIDCEAIESGIAVAKPEVKKSQWFQWSK